jgi:hypothetical protein
LAIDIAWMRRFVDNVISLVYIHLSVVLDSDGHWPLEIKIVEGQIFIEGSLELKLPTIWTDEKQRWEESEKKKEDQKRESLRKKKIQVREKVGKSRNTVFFQ